MDNNKILNQFFGKIAKKIEISKNNKDDFDADYIKIEFNDFDKILILSGTVNGSWSRNGECYIDEYYTVIYIEDIVGDLNDILNAPLLKAEGRKKEHEWAFYEFSTIKGSVTIRFNDCGSSGHYSSCAEVQALIQGHDDLEYYNNDNKAVYE